MNYQLTEEEIEAIHARLRAGTATPMDGALLALHTLMHDIAAMRKDEGYLFKHAKDAVPPLAGLYQTLANCAGLQARACENAVREIEADIHQGKFGP